MEALVARKEHFERGDFTTEDAEAVYAAALLKICLFRIKLPLSGSFLYFPHVNLIFQTNIVAYCNLW